MRASLKSVSADLRGGMRAKRLLELIKAILTRRPPTRAEIELMSTKELRKLIETQGRTEIAGMARDELEFRNRFERESAVTTDVRHDF